MPSKPELPSPSPDERDAEALSELRELGLELARAFQAKALAAVQAGGLDRAERAEAGFNRTALGIRRAIALSLSPRNRVGGVLAAPLLPHHRAYGSVHGGS